MTTSLLPDVGTELREGYAEVGDAKLHYVEAGEGPLIVLLHGFPEFWFGWRLQIAPLAAAGFRVVAPDTRGYNLSSKPEGFEAYGPDAPAAGRQPPPPSSIPVGFTTFPGEIWRTPRSWAESSYPNLVYFNEVDKGGHFAAWEEPQLFSEELRAAFASGR